MKGTLQIARPSFGCGREAMIVTIKCESSRTGFVEAEITLEGFMKALTGHGGIECDFKVRGIENVGKQKESTDFTFKLPEGTTWLNKKEVAIEVADAACPEGWSINKYFGSQESFYSEGDDEYVRTTIYRYVALEEP